MTSMFSSSIFDLLQTQFKLDENDSSSSTSSRRIFRDANGFFDSWDARCIFSMRLFDSSLSIHRVLSSSSIRSSPSNFLLRSTSPLGPAASPTSSASSASSASRWQGKSDSEIAISLDRATASWQMAMPIHFLDAVRRRYDIPSGAVEKPSPKSSRGIRNRVSTANRSNHELENESTDQCLQRAKIVFTELKRGSGEIRQIMKRIHERFGPEHEAPFLRCVRSTDRAAPPNGASCYPDQGLITLTSGLPSVQIASSLVYELVNLDNGDRLVKIVERMKSGKLNPDEFAEAIEREEYHTSIRSYRIAEELIRIEYFPRSILRDIPAPEPEEKYMRWILSTDHAEMYREMARSYQKSLSGFFGRFIPRINKS